MTSPPLASAARLSARFLTPKDVASLLGVSLATIYRLVEQRDIACYRIGGGLRITSEDIERYLATHRVDRLTNIV